jgi:DNA-directed RNA polymerase specialized sigma subunit
MNKSADNNAIFAKEEEEELIKRAKNGDNYAREELWKKLQPLIRKIVADAIIENVREYFDDLVQEGNRGLLKAFEKYDLLNPEGARLSTYARKFIWEKVDRAKWRYIGAPDAMVSSISTVYKAKNTLEKQGVKNPDVSEIARKAKVSIKKTKEILDFLNNRFYHIERDSEDGSPYDWLSKEGTNNACEDEEGLHDNGLPNEDTGDPWENDEGGSPDDRVANVDTCDPCEEIEENVASSERAWEFKDEDIGFINPRIAKHLTEKWQKVDIDRCKQFVSAIEGPARCLNRRLVLSNGSRGMLDLTILKEINKFASGLDVYDRRWAWKKHSSF